MHFLSILSGGKDETFKIREWEKDIPDSRDQENIMKPGSSMNPATEENGREFKE